MKEKAGKMNINDMTVWGAKELQEAGFSRSMSYQILARKDFPTMKLGGRLFILREPFLAWLQTQTEA